MSMIRLELSNRDYNTIAEALLDAYIQYGREHLAFLTLEVREGNAPAIALYEKLGFRRTEAPEFLEDGIPHMEMVLERKQ